MNPLANRKAADDSGTASLLFPVKTLRYRLDHQARNDILPIAISRQRSILDAGVPERAYHIREFSLRSSRRWNDEDPAPVVITAAKGDLAAVRDQSAQQVKPLPVWVSRRGFSPPTNCSYKSPLTGFSPCQMKAIFSPSGKTGSQTVPGRLVSGTIRIRDEAAAAMSVQPPVRMHAVRPHGEPETP